MGDGGDGLLPGGPRARAVVVPCRGRHRLTFCSRPPVSQFTVKTIAAKARVARASTTPIALARPNWPFENAVVSSRCGITRVELSGPPPGLSACHVDERVEGQDAQVDVGGLDVVADQRDRDRPRRPDPAGAVQPDRVVVVRRDPLDRCDEQHHVEAHEAPDDHEHRGRHGGAGVAEPGEAGELVEPELGEDAVQQAGGRVEHLTPQDADDDRRDRVGEERDHPVEVGVPDPARGPVRGAPHRDHRGQHEAEHDGHEGHHDRQQDVVPERGHEDVVVRAASGSSADRRSSCRG